jgi:hypothetical protein
MNLHGIVSGIISAVNPMTPATLQISTGSTTNAGGVRTPTYGYPQQVSAQIQALTADDLRQLDGLNIQGTKRGIYLMGKLDGLVRVDGKGGDLITFPDGTVWPFGTTWLTVQVLEQWPDWCKVAATLQNGS